MSKVQLSVLILGCGSALPNLRYHQSAQIVSSGSKLFLVDCGEGTQLELRRNKVKLQQIDHVFISHLHGDHYFGLPGLLSTMHLLGRTKALHIHGPKELKELVEIQFQYGGHRLAYQTHFVPIETAGAVIYEDKHLTVTTLPLTHRVKCFGFLFQEKPKLRKLLPEKLQQYSIPVYARHGIKEGKDFVQQNGKIIPNEELTSAADPSKSYAYCSDTAYEEALLPFIKGVDLLYHEATFQEDLKSRAATTFHSTALDAAKIAKQAGAAKLLIGHFSNRYANEEDFEKEAKRVFPNVEAAKEGKVYTP